MYVEFTGVLSIRDISHAQLLEKMQLFAQLVGRRPRMTVCPHDRVVFYVVLQLLDTGLVIENHQHTQTIVEPVNGVYNGVSLF